MDRHRTAEHVLVELTATPPAGVRAAGHSVPEAVAVVPAPRRSVEDDVVVPAPRGWRARRVARAEASAARDRAVALANAQRRARQVALASLSD